GRVCAAGDEPHRKERGRAFHDTSVPRPHDTGDSVIDMLQIHSPRTVAVAVAAALLCTAGAASADRHRSFGSGGFASNGTFGLGLEIGEPTGLNGKYFMQPDRAIDFGLGAIYRDYRGGDGFHVYADYLWHPTTLVRAQAFQMPFYVGIGGRF